MSSGTGDSVSGTTETDEDDVAFERDAVNSFGFSAFGVVVGDGVKVEAFEGELFRETGFRLDSCDAFGLFDFGVDSSALTNEEPG